MCYVGPMLVVQEPVSSKTVGGLFKKVGRLFADPLVSPYKSQTFWVFLWQSSFGVFGFIRFESSPFLGFQRFVAETLKSTSGANGSVLFRPPPKLVVFLWFPLKTGKVPLKRPREVHQ